MGPITITPNKLLIILSCCELNLTCKECCILQNTKHLFTSCPKGKVCIFIRTTQLTETFFLGVVPCSIESRFCFYTMGSWRFPGCYRKQVLFLYHGVLEIPWVLQKVGSVSIPWGLGDSLGVIESRFCFYTMGSWRFPGCYRKQVLFLYHGVLEIPWVLQKVGSVSIPWGLGDSLSVIESRFCFYTMGSWRFPECYRKQVLFLYHGVLEIP